MKINNHFANQRKVKVNRTNVVRNSGLTYACIYRYSMENAMYNLKPSTFKVWLWLASNKPNYSVEYSPAYLNKVINISINTAKSAFNELIEKGYIVEDNVGGRLYNFYEEPQIQDKSDIKEILNPYTGEYITLTYIQTLAMFGVEKGNELWG